jgi:hypothetical protein
MADDPQGKKRALLGQQKRHRQAAQVTRPWLRWQAVTFSLAAARSLSAPLIENNAIRAAPPIFMAQEMHG